ncbi:MAG TPA: hypothetical protein DCS55_22360, partial [Acidimicrobiaceae bacterium]|nr:hypothetical protein [Acidimicrobiaceae bacterium]
MGRGPPGAAAVRRPVVPEAAQGRHPFVVGRSRHPTSLAPPDPFTARESTIDGRFAREEPEGGRSLRASRPPAVDRRAGNRGGGCGCLRSPAVPAAVPDLLRRLAALRSWASTPGRRRIAYAVAVAIFVGSTVAAWQALPADRGDIDWSLIALAALLVVPGAVVNAEEYRVSARIVGQRVALPAALRVSIIAAAFNLLPVPGSVLVRTRALAKGGSSTGQAVTSTLAVGLAYIAVALVIVAVVQVGAAPVQAVVLLVIGLAMLGGAAVLVRRLADGPVGGMLQRLVAVEALSVLVKAVRLYLTIEALGFDPSIAQATSLSMATVAASAIGIFPGGLGIRELLSGLIAPAVDLPASVGLVGTSMDRVIGLATLSVLAAIVLFATRERLPRPDDGSHP